METTGSRAVPESLDSASVTPPWPDAAESARDASGAGWEGDGAGEVGEAGMGGDGGGSGMWVGVGPVTTSPLRSRDF